MALALPVLRGCSAQHWRSQWHTRVGCYGQRRRRLVGFLRRIEADERGTYRQHAGVLPMLRYCAFELAHEHPDVPGAAVWLAPFVAEDEALALYALAVRFLR